MHASWHFLTVSYYLWFNLPSLSSSHHGLTSAVVQWPITRFASVLIPNKLLNMDIMIWSIRRSRSLALVNLFLWFALIGPNSQYFGHYWGNFRNCRVPLVLAQRNSSVVTFEHTFFNNGVASLSSGLTLVYSGLVKLLLECLLRSFRILALVCHVSSENFCLKTGFRVGMLFMLCRRRAKM